MPPNAGVSPFCGGTRYLTTQVNEADQAVTNLLGEVQKLEAKRTSVRNVMTQTNKELGQLKKASVTTTEHVQQKEELLEQVRPATCARRPRARLCARVYASGTARLQSRHRPGVGR